MSVVTESLVRLDEAVLRRVIKILCKVADFSSEQIRAETVLDIPITNEPFYIGVNCVGSGEFLELNTALAAEFSISELTSEELGELRGRRDITPRELTLLVQRRMSGVM